MGESPGLRRIYDVITRVAPTQSTVLILGESGTGKELAARALHQASRRSAGPFVAINGAVNELKRRLITTLGLRGEIEG